WMRSNPNISPPARSFATMATVHAFPGPLVVLTTGRVAGGAGLNDTWIWDGTTWTEQHPRTSPPARAGAVLARGPRRQLVLFSGGGLETHDDTWTLDVAPAPKKDECVRVKACKGDGP